MIKKKYSENLNSACQLLFFAELLLGPLPVWEINNLLQKARVTENWGCICSMAFNYKEKHKNVNTVLSLLLLFKVLDFHVSGGQQN